MRCFAIVCANPQIRAIAPKQSLCRQGSAQSEQRGKPRARQHHPHQPKSHFPPCHEQNLFHTTKKTEIHREAGNKQEESRTRDAGGFQRTLRSISTSRHQRARHGLDGNQHLPSRLCQGCAAEFSRKRQRNLGTCYHLALGRIRIRKHCTQ